MRPESRTPSRSASIGREFSGKSFPITCAMRRSSPSSPASEEGNSVAVRSGEDQVKRTPGKAMAMRFTTSAMALVSARSPFMNFSLAGVAKKRSRTSTIVPWLAGAGRTAETAPPLTWISAPEPASAVRERMVSLPTEPIEGSASPRKPSERISWRSPESFDVQCRATASGNSPSGMPPPSSETRIRPSPPPETTISTRPAPASSAFSTSSLTTLAGRSITSPAAIWLIIVSESCRIAMMEL